MFYKFLNIPSLSPSKGQLNDGLKIIFFFGQLHMKIFFCHFFFVLHILATLYPTQLIYFYYCWINFYIWNLFWSITPYIFVMVQWTWYHFKCLFTGEHFVYLNLEIIFWKIASGLFLCCKFFFQIYFSSVIEIRKAINWCIIL